MDASEFPEHLDDLMGAYQRSQVFMTALKAGVFDHLETPCDAEAVARETGWSPRGARMLLDGLVAIELVEKENGTYRNAPIASHCLVAGGPNNQTHILRHKAGSWGSWSQLEEAVRTGTGIRPPGRSRRSPEELRDFICGMADIGRQSAQSVLDAVDLSPYRRLLDVGGGPATYAVAFLNAHEAMGATLFDVEDVIPIAREQVQAAGLEDRVDFVAGDFNETAIGTGFDLVLVSNIIHMLGPDANRALVKKCHEALEPGGLLIVKDFLMDTGRTGPAFGQLFALHMLLHTEAGDTYTQEEVAQWTAEAGFAPGRVVDVAQHTRLWLAERG